MQKLTTEERFWSKVTKGDGCWNWNAHKNTEGYGHFWMDGRTHRAHRVSYVWAHGPLGSDALVDHKCHNASCVRPEHLRPATRKQNGEHRKGAQRNNMSSGVRGVTRDGNRWLARVKHNGKDIYFGSYSTIAEAETVVKRERARLFSYCD